MYLRRAHGRQAVTSVVVQDGATEADEPVVMVWTSGRDGEFVQWRVRGVEIDGQVGDDVMIEKNVEDVREVKKSNSRADEELEESEEEEEEEEDQKDTDNIIDMNSVGMAVEKVYRSKITKGWLEEVRPIALLWSLITSFILAVWLFLVFIYPCLLDIVNVVPYAGEIH